MVAAFVACVRGTGWTVQFLVNDPSRDRMGAKAALPPALKSYLQYNHHVVLDVMNECSKLCRYRVKSWCEGPVDLLEWLLLHRGPLSTCCRAIQEDGMKEFEAEIEARTA